jgi:hypothetical protein
MNNFKDFYRDFIDHWTIPLSVGAVIIAIIVNYFIKEDKSE